jgi:hypothetical protein
VPEPTDESVGYYHSSASPTFAAKPSDAQRDEFSPAFHIAKHAAHDLSALIDSDMGVA